MSFAVFSALSAALLVAVQAQNIYTFNDNTITVPSVCEAGFDYGFDQVLLTIPYSYSEVISVVGNYGNITWTGTNATSLNGTDNVVGTARTYNFGGAVVTETIDEYSKPPAGPYVEVHTTSLSEYPSYNLSVYIPTDSSVFSSVCNGKATLLNMTTVFCANNVTTAGTILHTAHSEQLASIGKLLGGQNYTGCGSTSPSNGTSSGGFASPTPSSTAPIEPFTGGARGLSAALPAAAVVLVAVGLGAFGLA
ncbi:Hypothetical predicted protein [Lecanosticta acicola]|uniref:Uncharacterized protein n=1 Tax=Lecanosticta acicola TaxID=111012 RepID=A0AAI8Z625_9PEZI|nr:Hypothetical predicted protein [Lecanosticta acicola]